MVDKAQDTTSLTARTLAHIAGYFDEKEESARLSRLQSQVRAPITAGESEAQFKDLLATSTDVAEIFEAGRLVMQTRQDAKVINYIASELVALRSTLRDRSVFSASQIAPALQFLNAELQTLMERVAEIDAELVDVHSADDALEAGHDKGQLWIELGSLTERYEEIRIVQRRLTMRDNDGAHLTALHQSGFVRNAFDHEAVWIERRRRSGTGTNMIRGEDRYHEWMRATPTLEWQRPGDRTWADGGDRHGYLRWLATYTQPWVPTIAQLTERHGLASDLVRKPGNITHLRNILKQRDSYYTAPDVIPAVAYAKDAAPA